MYTHIFMYNCIYQYSIQYTTDIVISKYDTINLRNLKPNWIYYLCILFRIINYA